MRIKELEECLKEAKFQIEEREQDVADVEQNLHISQRNCREGNEELAKLRERIVELESLMGTICYYIHLLCFIPLSMYVFVSEYFSLPE